MADNLDERIMQTARDIDRIKAGGKPMADKGGPDLSIIIAEFPSASKLAPGAFASIISQLPELEGKSPEEISAMLQDDDALREKIVRMIAEAIDAESDEGEDKMASEDMKRKMMDMGSDKNEMGEY
jgi:hypothetical protein